MTPNLVLRYGKAPVRVIVAADGLWFAAADVFHSIRQRTDRSTLARFDPAHLRLLSFPSDEGAILLTAVSPLGVATIASRLAFPHCRILDIWVRREANKLSISHGLPLLEMSLLADESLPARPRVASDHYEAWSALRVRYPYARRRDANRYEPTLFDNDPSVPPHDPEEGREAVRAIMAAGEVPVLGAARPAA